jgi:hypothetical protein
MKGIELLVAGRSVKTVAAEVGYRQPSAFVELSGRRNDTENIGYRARGPRKANEAEIVGDVQCSSYAELPTDAVLWQTRVL